MAAVTEWGDISFVSYEGIFVSQKIPVYFDFLFALYTAVFMFYLFPAYSTNALPSFWPYLLLYSYVAVIETH
jgi:hypothetical protein